MKRFIYSFIISLLFFAAAPVNAAGPKNCYYRLLGWTPDGTGYVKHMECVGENLSNGTLSKVNRQDAESVELCDTASCSTPARATIHPKVKALRLRPSGRAPKGLSAKVGVRKGSGRTLVFKLTKGRKTIRLGKKNVGGARWRFKEALWEPQGRAVAFTFRTTEGRDDKGESFIVFPVPESVRPTTTRNSEPAVPFGLRFGMTMADAIAHLARQKLRPQRVGSSLELEAMKFLGHTVLCSIDFRNRERLSGVRFTSSLESASKARRLRRGIKSSLKKGLGRRTKARGSLLFWIGREVKVTYYEGEESTGAPGGDYWVTIVTFEPVK